MTAPATTRDLQLELLFDSLLPAGKQTFTPVEIAALVCVDEKSIHNALTREDPEGQLLGWEFNFNGTGQRKIRRVPRAFLIAWLVRHATFTFPVLRANFADMCAHLSTSFLRLYLEIAAAELALRRD